MKMFTKPKVIKLVLLLGGVAVAAKLIGAKKGEWEGLSEADVRNKIDTRMPDRVPDEKRAAVADKVVAKMKTRGLIVEDVEEVAPEAPADDQETEEETPEEPSN
jgi:hypothetical protein